AGAGRGGHPLDDAERPERGAHGEPRDPEGQSSGPRGWDEDSARAGASSESLADAGGARLSQRSRAADGRGTVRDEGPSSGREPTRPDRRRDGIPPFAPGPADPRWQAILWQHPELAPACSRYDRFVDAL